MHNTDKKTITQRDMMRVCAQLQFTICKGRIRQGTLVWACTI